MYSGLSYYYVVTPGFKDKTKCPQYIYSQFDYMYSGHSVFSLKLCDRSGIKALITVGRKPRIELVDLNPIFLKLSLTFKIETYYAILT